MKQQDAGSKHRSVFIKKTRARTKTELDTGLKYILDWWWDKGHLWTFK